MSGPLALVASAVIPCLLLLWYFSRRDLFPEPPARIWAAFWAGVAALLLALAAALPIQLLLPAPEAVGPYLYGLMDAFLAAAVPEECAKFLVLRRFCRKTPECDEPMDCVVYATAASLGFAALENIFYVQDGGFSLALMRAVSAVPAHALDGAVMGYFLGRALFTRPGSPLMYALALAAPICFHGLYDSGPLILTAFDATGAFLPEDQGLALAFMALATLLVQALFAAALISRLRAEQRLVMGMSAARQPAAGPARSKARAALAFAAGVLLVIGSLLVLGLAALGSVGEMGTPGFLAELALGLSILVGPPLLAGGWLIHYARKRFRSAAS